jgi:hypothetical protein
MADAVAEWEAVGNPDALLRIKSCKVFVLPPLPASVRSVHISCVHLSDMGDLSGLHALEMLQLVDCAILRSVGPLPAGLKLLSLRNCGEFASRGGGGGILPELPEGLQDFRLYDCAGITQLPRLPSSLSALTCWNCPLLQELGPLPEGLHSMLLRDCALIRQLSRLPPAFTYIQLNRCPLITHLPPLPSTLIGLHCQDCNVACLPALPPRLRYLSYSVLPPTLPRLPDVRPRCLECIKPLEWKRRLAAQHAADRFAAAPHLPTAALLFL